MKTSGFEIGHDAEVSRERKPLAKRLASWGVLHNAPERFNPGSRRQSGASFDPDFSNSRTISAA
jgi:hypothetical protein